MKARALYVLLVLVPAFWLAGCQNMADYSPAYRQAHEKAFWQAYKGGGPGAMAEANLRAHDAAEKAAGR
jgi:hypothetical protein